MLNRFPLWKNLLVALVVIVGFLYSAPNLYGEDPALQVSAARGAEGDRARRAVPRPGQEVLEVHGPGHGRPPPRVVPAPGSNTAREKRAGADPWLA